ncbi:hypothetical protein ACJRO7_003116 [Eucalyptus globulus]|uniref:WAT1-related protein n=1 Tax=Eucalyptus globulus TaxID=34317 RepID=A0ABD3ITS0_EUCGL
MGGGREWCRQEVLPFSAMITVDSIAVGVTTLFKAANSRGMRSHVVLVYAYTIASLLLLPAAFFSLKSRALPPLSVVILAKVGVLGLGFSQILGYAGNSMSSPTLASAIGNLTPALTFILAILFTFQVPKILVLSIRVACGSLSGILPILVDCCSGSSMEEVSLSKRNSQAKIIGTILSISRTSVITLYRGPPVIFTPKPPLSLYPLVHTSNLNWVTGGILLTADYILITSWYILLIMKEYPAELTVIFFYNVIVTFMNTIVCLITEHDMSAWRVRGIGLASVICWGLFERCLTNIIHTWAIQLKGPFCVAMFKPLSIPVAVAMGQPYCPLGSILGKAKEEMVDESVDSLQKAPLLR